MALITDYREREFIGDMKYELRYNGDDTISLVDTTEYRPITSKTIYVNSSYINTTNEAVNRLAALYGGWIGSYSALKANYVDATWDGLKKYEMTTNGEYVTLVDRTQYTTAGDNYRATDINATNTLLNRLESGFTSGRAQIVRQFNSMGITNTNDLASAVDLLVQRYESLGYNQGKNDVLNNPGNYGLVTKSRYDTLKTNMRNEIPKIAQIRSSLVSSNTSADDKAIADNQEIDLITAGMSKFDAEYSIMVIEQDGRNIVSIEDSAVSTYNTNRNAEVTRLNNLLNS